MRITGVHLGGRQKSITGQGFFDFLDPNKNGVANAFRPIENTVTKTIPSFLIHQALPTVGEFAGSKLGLGKQGRELATMGANELGNVSGLGLCDNFGLCQNRVEVAGTRPFRKGTVRFNTLKYYFKIIYPDWNTEKRRNELQALVHQGMSNIDFDDFKKKGQKIYDDKYG